jgi:hypothetical protein
MASPQCADPPADLAATVDLDLGRRVSLCDLPASRVRRLLPAATRRLADHAIPQALAISCWTNGEK